MLFNVVVQFLRTLHLTNDGCTGNFLQNKARKKEKEFVSPEDIATVGYDTNTISIAIIGNTDGSFFLFEPGQSVQ